MGKTYEINLSDSMDMKSNGGEDIDSLFATNAPATCDECPRSKYCLEEPIVSKQEAKKFLKENIPTGNRSVDRMLVKWAQERVASLPACPRLIEKVREDDQLVRDIKKVVKGEAKVVERNE